MQILHYLLKCNEYNLPFKSNVEIMFSYMTTSNYETQEDGICYGAALCTAKNCRCEAEQVCNHTAARPTWIRRCHIRGSMLYCRDTPSTSRSTPRIMSITRLSHMWVVCNDVTLVDCIHVHETAMLRPVRQIDGSWSTHSPQSWSGN